MFKKFKDISGSYKEKAKLYKELNAKEQKRFELAPQLSWKTYLYPAYEKGKYWYVLAIIAVLGFAAYGVLTNSWTFSVVVLITAGVYYYIHSQDNPVIEVVVTDVGIRVGERVYRYTDLKTYWIDYNPPYVQDLHLVLRNDLKQDITIQMHGPNPTEVRTVLSQYLPEWEERQKNFTESITNVMGL